MAKDKATIDVLLRMQDFATKELKKFEKESRRSGTEASKQLRKADKSATNLTKRLVKVVGAVGAIYAAFRAGKAILGTGFGMVEDAARAEEAIAKFQVVFGQEAQKTLDIIDGYTKAVGRSRTQLIEFTSGLQDTFVPLGLARDEAAKLSLAISALAVDVASFSNKLDEDVIRDFTSGLVGETEPLRKYGVIINEARVKAEALQLGLVGVNGEITDLAKVAARANLIVKGTTDAQGDAARTAGSWTNTIKRLKAQIGELRVQIGGFVRDQLLLMIERLGGVDTIVEGAGIALATSGQAAITFANIIVDAAIAFSKIIGAGGKAQKFLEKIFSGFQKVEREVRVFFIKLPRFIEQLKLAFAELELSITSTFSALLTGLDSAPGIKVPKEQLDGLALAADLARERVLELKDLVGRRKAVESVPIAALDFALRSAKKSAEEIIAAIFRLGEGAPTLENLKGQALAASGAIKELLASFTGDAKGKVDEANAAAAALAERQARIAKVIGEAFDKFKLKVVQARMKGDLYKKSLEKQTESAAAAREEFRQLANEARRIAEAQAKAADSAGAVKEAYDEWIDSLSNASLAGGAARGVFGALEAGISDLSRRLVDSEASFKGWARSVVQSIGQVLAEFFLLQALRTAFGGLFGPAEIGSAGSDVAGPPVAPGFDYSGVYEKGGVHQGTMLGSIPVNAYANGGIATSPQLALFGEGRGAEAFVPLPDGRSIPVTMSGGGGGANVTINLNAIDSKSGVEFLEANAKAIGDTISSQIEAGANRKLNRAVGRA